MGLGEFTAAKQYVIDLADFIEGLLDLGVRSHAFSSLLDLDLGLEQKGLKPAFGKAAVEVKEGAVLWAICMAATVGLATFDGTFDQGSMHEMGWEVKGAQEMSFALAKSQG